MSKWIVAAAIVLALIAFKLTKIAIIFGLAAFVMFLIVRKGIFRF